MKLERTKNATRNIVFGVILKVYQILIPFLMRTAMIYLMGVQYLGLDSLFKSLLQVLNLAELGVGTAMVFSMYKPITEDDTETICALMKLYRLYYRIIGTVIAVVGGILTPFIPHLIHGSVPHGINIYVLYLLNLSATVLTYWLFAYKNSIFQAYQRIDVPSKVTLLTNTIQYGLQFFVLWAFHNYYLFLIVLLLTQALNNILTAIIATKMYPQYKPVGEISKTEIAKINHRIRDLFTSKVGAVIVNSADTLVISAFLGLTMLAIYQNYFYILTAITGILMVAFQACTAGIGNSLIVETKEKNFNDLKKFTLFICWISAFCACCMLTVYQPFMKLWVGPKLLLPYSAVVCLVIYFVIMEVNTLLNTYKDAGGIWHEDRFRPLVTALTNLGLNLVMVQFWGIYGVLLSTVLSAVFVGMPWLFYNLFTTLFEKSQFKSYLFMVIKYLGLTTISAIISIWLCSYIHMHLILTVIVAIVVSTIVSNLIYFISLRKTPEFYGCMVLVDNMTKNKFNFVRLAGNKSR